MSKEQLKAFLEKVQGDTSLQEKLKAAADTNAVAAIAKEAGFSISADDLTKGQSELSDEELIAVNGGGAGATFGWVAANVFTGGIPIAADILFSDGKVTKAAADY